ncbi:MAG: (deoxy)nucleoside triphosphate pyrophosphohydrolase [Alphaproteobacteria bacterium]|nr:(deoxy)nucleoside triphosphate pyrophosphohydrolase [Alphaproteobacteria bacterium]
MDEKPHIRVVAAEIERDGRYLITQRRAQAVLPHLWEFPGGRVEPGEDDTTALLREVRERVGVTIRVGELSLHVAHEYDEYVLDLLVYRATLTEGDPKPLRVADVRWVAPQDFGRFEFPGADQQTVDKLLNGGD